MQPMTMNELTKEIENIILKKSGKKIRQIFLFGSRAKGINRNKNADIDIGILAEKPLSLLELSKIKDEIENLSTLLKIDIVDFTGRKDDFTEEALSNIEVIYEKRKNA